MAQFRDYLNEAATISDSDLKHWSVYASKMQFATPQEAHDWIFRKLQLQDQSSSAAVFGVKGPEKNRAFADAMPLYQSGKVWKIGKKVRGPDNRFRLSHLQVKKPSPEYLHNTTYANTESQFEYKGIQWLKISDLMGSEPDVYSNGREAEYIKELAYKIKTNGWIEAVIVGKAPDGYELWEGQHRTRAMKVLGFNTVPAFVVEIEE